MAGRKPADRDPLQGTALEPGAENAETIGFLLIPRFSLIAFAAAIEPLRLANHLTGKRLYDWELLSRDGGSERASNGIAVGVGHSMADAPAFSALIVCAGIDGHWYDDRQVIAWLRRMATKSVPLGAICTASHILARAGLLGGYRCTVHWDSLASFSENYPEIVVTGDIFTVDRNRFTCAGGTAAADMMLHRIAARHGEDLAARVSEQMLHDKIRPAAMQQNAVIQQPLGIERQDLQAAIKLMLATIEQPLDLLTLAKRLGQSRRNVERLFRTYMNCSPGKYYLGLRLIRARQLLHQTSKTVQQVAVCCGFSSAAHFSRCYRDHYGVPPRSDQISSRYRMSAFADSVAEPPMPEAVVAAQTGEDEGEEHEGW
ncbi:AraC family transcriptional regulator with amidase-like domain [Breoghania corrubedonensis]|uniref:AraC family transcriptional regulator with amidase-like domain n=1 Tax=Breoghania corrubedonensis TaxID=665038 RepID=A0A2T5V7W7_9HYPH|nr:GlxA family transcriptional regulator [Breoghania corrubedonensis]PTW59828.1 AraC family transcriptional regulator with amidase-like domain [Breoghania corrubedonensis]